MKSIPQQVSKSMRDRNPQLYGGVLEPVITGVVVNGEVKPVTIPPKRIRLNSVLNKTEQKYLSVLERRGVAAIMKQSITLRMDPPYKSYRPDLAYVDGDTLRFIEVKGPHRFRNAGIAKAALAAKTYPQFRFILADWVCGEWKESVLSS